MEYLYYDIITNIYRYLDKIDILNLHWTSSIFRQYNNKINIELTIKKNINDSNLYNLYHIKNLNLSLCKSITFRGCKHIKNVNTLNISYSNMQIEYMNSFLVNTNNSKSKITDKALMYIKNVENLNIRNCRLVTDKGLLKLKNIISLNIGWCNNITNKSIISFTNIEILDITGCNNINDDIFIHLSKLRDINVSYCDNISNNGLKQLHNNKIEKICIKFTNKGNISDDGIIGLKYLINANLKRSYITDKSIITLTNIKILNINSLQINGDVFKYLHFIEELYTNDNELIFDKHLEYLSKCKILSLKKCGNISGYGFKYLKNICSINVMWNHNIKDEDLYYLKGAFDINISNCYQISDIGIYNILYKNNNEYYPIKHLNINECNLITDHILEYIWGLKDIIMRWNKNITDNGLYLLYKNNPNLKSINISYCNKITQIGINYFSNIKVILDS